jgi:hypothetical protein
MLDVTPVVRHMLLCEDVQPRGNNSGKLDLLGLTSIIRPTGASSGPRRVILLGVFLQVIELHGNGFGQIFVSDADATEDVYAGARHRIARAASPLMLTPLFFRIGPVDFPQPGLFLGRIPLQ